MELPSKLHKTQPSECSLARRLLSMRAHGPQHCRVMHSVLNFSPSQIHPLTPTTCVTRSDKGNSFLSVVSLTQCCSSSTTVFASSPRSDCEDTVFTASHTATLCDDLPPPLLESPCHRQSMTLYDMAKIFKEAGGYVPGSDCFSLLPQSSTALGLQPIF